MEDEGRAVLICAGAEEGYAVEGTDYGHSCGVCGGRVQVAPSGQRLLRREKVIIWCLGCYGRKAAAVEVEGAPELAGTVAEVEAELKTAGRNRWRERN